MVPLDGLTYRLGQKLIIDPQTEMTTSQEANVILKGTYRKPFVVPSAWCRSGCAGRFLL